jgi:C1A family cysteine protease
LIVLVAVFCLGGVLCGALRAAEMFIEAAPVSGAFLDYRYGLARGSVASFSGYRPSPVDLSHLRGADYSGYLRSEARSGADVPVSYDLRRMGYVTGVRNQGALDACWAFSSIASMESAFLRGGGAPLDLSEMFLFWYAFNDGAGLTPLGPGGTPGGGYDNTAVSTFARWTGPVLEETVPIGNTPVGPARSYPAALHLQDAFFLNLEFDEEQSALQPTNDVRKRLLMDYGAISVGCKAPGGPYDARSLWPFSQSKEIPDHSVLLVGWDDEYSSDGFKTRPSSAGAWLVKNSWGEAWGDAGYYWISYEDRVFSDGVAFLAEGADNYDFNYGYDELGWCASVRLDGARSPWMANTFVAASEGEVLEAVSFYTTAANAAYEVRIYSGVPQGGMPNQGTEAARLSGVEPFAGYHTVELTSPVPLRRGARFSVAVRMTSPYAYPLAVEAKVTGFSDNAASNRGESFFSSDGETWSDVFDIPASILEGSPNACVRAFTSVPGSLSDPPKGAFSGDPKDWEAFIIDLGNLAHVRIYGRITSDATPVSIAVDAEGLKDVSAVIGDSKGYPIDSYSSSGGAGGGRYLIIEGTAASEADALRASVKSIAYSLGGLDMLQFAGSPIKVGDMSRLESSPAEGGGGGGCGLGLPPLLLMAAACVGFACGRIRKKP